MISLLKISDICKQLSISRTTLYQLINRGDLKPIRVMGAVRFASADIDAYVEKLREEASESADRAA